MSLKVDQTGPAFWDNDSQENNPMREVTCMRETIFTSPLIRNQTPEEREFRKKSQELIGLEAELADYELDLATVQAELAKFETTYMSIVGVRLAELDEIEAQIAEAEAHQSPQDEKQQENARQARRQARKSAEASGVIQEFKESKFVPSETLKKLYREVAKKIHPDLSSDEEDRVKRQKIMAEANQAYSDGDEAWLRKILTEWESSPESVKGDGTGADLVRIIRKIAQIEDRIEDIKAEINELKKSDLYILQTKTEKAETEGRDLLGELADEVNKKIKLAKNRLERITAINHG
jgi:DNA repair exonuclease SbcCD ATPase subunit